MRALAVLRFQGVSARNFEMGQRADGRALRHAGPVDDFLKFDGRPRCLGVRREEPCRAHRPGYRAMENSLLPGVPNSYGAAILESLWPSKDRCGSARAAFEGLAGS